MWIVDLILGPLGALLAAILAGGGAYLAGKSKGKQETQADAMQDTHERLDKGRNAVRDGRGADPSERLRENDGRW